MKIGVILGSIREGRAGKPVADWVMGRAQQRTGVDYELVDVADYDLPMLDAGMPGMVSDGDYGDERVNRWAAKIAEFDGFVFVTAEYNHGIPGAFKNAVDLLGAEWQHKAVAFVGYGALYGARVVEAWRVVLANFAMYDIRSQIGLSIFTDIADGAVKVNERTEGDLETLFNELEPATKAMQALRA